MAEQDTLRVAAELVDKWSGPLRAMQQELRRLLARSKAAERVRRLEPAHQLSVRVAADDGRHPGAGGGGLCSRRFETPRRLSRTARSRNSGAGVWHRGLYGAMDEARRAMQDGGLHGDALSRHFGHPARPNRDLLDHARRSGIVASRTINGDASLRIDLSGFLRGTRTRTTATGNVQGGSAQRREVDDAGE